MNRGMLWGVGVGPGDPELITVKALRTMRESDVILVPGRSVPQSTAYRIAAAACPEIGHKQQLALEMPMTMDHDERDACHEEAADRICGLLEEGKMAAFLTLGDPSLYSTYLYVQEKVLERGYRAGFVSGVPSFCAAAARLNIGLTEDAEQLHILPASYDTEPFLRLPGTRILMKAGKNMKELRTRLKGLPDEVYLAENCGMAGEALYTSAEDIPDDTGYFSLVIVKNRK